jgi:hypothetical protein
MEEIPLKQPPSRQKEAFLKLPGPKPGELRKSKTRMVNAKKTMFIKKRIVVEGNEREVYTLKQFIRTLKHRIAGVNKYLSLDAEKAIDQRIRFTEGNHFVPTQNDLVFGFKVTLRTNSWM